MVMYKYNSRRSPILGTRGIVATSQPLASEAGMRILQQGGNAADAAVAAAAALNVTEPTSTGIGGDCFTIYFDNTTKQVKGINGSGRAPRDLSISQLNDLGIEKTLPNLSVHTITVPGAAAGWIDTVEKFGKLSMEEILQPAIQLAEGGYPVAPLTAYFWKRGVKQLKTGPYANQMLKNGRAPRLGEIIKLPNLAKTFKIIADQGKAGFYEGRIAQSIVDLIQDKGGYMTLADLKSHHSTFDSPISVNYKGVDIYEIPPNGQGITALLGFNILEELQIEEKEHLSTDYLHTLIETMRIAFADTRWYVADPVKTNVPTKELLSKNYARQRSKLFEPKQASLDAEKGSPTLSSDTVYLSVVDSNGNACSFINSNYMGFGTGLIPKGCGFTLQNRGKNFSLDPKHPNCLAPGKRPYHTIIPGMATKNNELYASFGVMGGFMQPQGHVQVMVNMIDFDFEPQTALDAPRFCIMDGTAAGKVALEEGIPVKVMGELARLGHPIVPITGYGRSVFGRGQIIRRNAQTEILWAGSDPRADGQAVAW